MKNIILIVALLFLGCSSHVDSSKLSVEEVLTNADNYLNKKVTVYGFLASGVGLRLFPSKKYADLGGALSKQF